MNAERADSTSRTRLCVWVWVCMGMCVYGYVGVWVQGEGARRDSKRHIAPKTNTS